MSDFVSKIRSSLQGGGDFGGVLAIARTSWSLLSQSEKTFFLVRIGFRFALNGLDIVAVALMGLLGAITATGLSGQNLQLFGYEIPSPTAQNVITLVAAVAALFIVKGALSILFQRWTTIFLAGLEVKYSAKIARYLFSGSLLRLRKYSRTEIGFLVQTSVHATFSGVLGSLTTLVIEGTLFLSIFVMFILVDWASALVIAAYFALFVGLLQLFTAARYLKSGRVLRESSVNSGDAVLEMVDAFREIAVLGKQDFFITRFVEARKSGARIGVDLQILKSVPRYLAETGLILGALIFVIWQLSRGSLSEGLVALGIFLAGSFRMMGAILPLQQVWNDLKAMQDWVEMAQQILLKLRDKPELIESGIYSETLISDRDSLLDMPDGAFSVHLDGVSFSHHGQSDKTIREVSIRIPEGSYVAIVGPSGAGKTTLVDLLLGLHDPEEGEIRVAGHDPRLIREESPGLVSYVPQRPGLVSGSIAQNIALGVPESQIDEKRVKQVLKKAQLYDVVSALPNGIHSSLGAHSDGLSGGQIQRLGFARALYSNPRLIILDEATSALDAGTEASVAASIKNVGDEATVIVIAHRLSTIQDADTVFVMDEGRIVATGTFSEVRKKVPLIEEYVSLMSFKDD